MANLVLSASYRYKMKAKKLFSKNYSGDEVAVWYEETKGNPPYISLKIPRSFSRLFFQSSSESLLMEVPYKTKTCSIIQRQ